MTSAATPAVNGHDSLVPPKSRTGGAVGPAPNSLKHALYLLKFGEQSDQPVSPGATTSMEFGPYEVNPALDSVAVLLLSQPLLWPSW